MFGFYKKPCEHERRVSTTMFIRQPLEVVNSNMEGEVEREIYICKDCRVLFAPLDKEKVINLHET